MPTVCIIIPMYGQASYTDKCIEFTRKNAGYKHHILVVDDGSPDQYFHEGVSIIRLDKNSGYTNATNQGLLWALSRNYDYALLLNNDTEPEKDFLHHLVEEMNSDTHIGITGSSRFHPSKEGERIALCGSDLIRGFQFFADESIPDKSFDTNIIPFASCLLRLDMVREIGLLDKKYINHCSDTEYCLRAKINNWRVVMVPKSRVMHHLSVTTTANNIMVDDDQRLFIEKLAGLDYAKIMNVMPLDAEAKTWGRITFEVYQR